MAKRKKAGKSARNSTDRTSARAHPPVPRARVQPKAPRNKPRKTRPKVRRKQPVSKSPSVRNRPGGKKQDAKRKRKSAVSRSRSESSKKGWETRRRNLENTPQGKLIAEIRLLRQERKSSRFEERLAALARELTDMRREALRQGRREGVKHAIQEGKKAFREFQHREIKRYLEQRGRLNKQGKIRKRKPLRRFFDVEREEWSTVNEAIPMWEIEDFLAETGIDDREFWSYYRGLS